MPSLAMSWASLQGGNPITTLAKKIYSVHSDFKPCFSHVQELRLSSDYLFLLRAQSSFDLVSAERITSKNISKNERHRQRSFFFVTSALPHHFNTHHRLSLRISRLQQEDRALRTAMDISVRTGDCFRKTRGEPLMTWSNIFPILYIQFINYPHTLCA